MSEFELEMAAKLNKMIAKFSSVAAFCDKDFDELERDISSLIVGLKKPGNSNKLNNCILSLTKAYGKMQRRTWSLSTLFEVYEQLLKANIHMTNYANRKMRNR